jgi:hypothetical protein
MTTALELNLIAVARQADVLFEQGDSFETGMVDVLDKKRVRTVASLLGEIAAWAEDIGMVLVWDAGTNAYSIIDEPDGYVAPERTTVAGPYGSATGS